MDKHSDKHSLTTMMLLLTSAMCLLIGMSIDHPVWAKFAAVGVGIVLVLAAAARLGSAMSAKRQPKG